MNPEGVDPDSEGWWAALAQGDLVVPRCRACRRSSFPPMPGCPHCGHDRFDEVLASGWGTVVSWVVVHRALDEAFAADVPYTIAAVELDEGARVFGRLVDDGPPHAGARVRVVPFRREGMALVGFSSAPSG